MKVLIFSHSFYPIIGGIETVSEVLSASFVEKGHEVILVTSTLETGDKKFPYEVIRNPGILALLKLIKASDVILENNPCVRMSWVNLLVRKPMVTALHTWIGENPNELSLKERQKRKWLSLSKKLIACSTALKNSISPDAIVIGNPYDSERFKRKPEIKRAKDFIFLGRLVSDKGVSIAIHAFKLYIDNNIAPDTTLTIVGTGAELNNLQRIVEDYGLEKRVIFTGPLQGEALVNELNKHKYLLVPSLWDEPFGIVVLEGMACGCIPIVSDGGGLPEAVGNAGLIFKKGDSHDLYQAMMKISRDEGLMKELRQASASHLEKHKLSTVSSEYLSVLERCVR